MEKREVLIFVFGLVFLLGGIVVAIGCSGDDRVGESVHLQPNLEYLPVGASLFKLVEIERLDSYTAVIEIEGRKFLFGIKWGISYGSDSWLVPWEER